MKRYILLSILSFFILACNTKNHSNNHDGHNHEENDSHVGHNHDEVKVQYIGYNEKYEIFAEADPFSIGTKSQIMAYITQLSDFKPLDNAKFHLSLIVGNKAITYRNIKPYKKGVYVFDINPKTAGKGKLVFKMENSQGISTVEIKDVKVFDDSHAAMHQHVEELPTINTTSFGKEQSWKIDFETQQPKYEEFGQIIKTTAQVQSAQNDEVVITAKSNGTVSFSPGNILEGMNVNVGTSIFVISSKGLIDDNTSVKFIEARNNYNKAKQDYERDLQLSKEKIVSAKELNLSKNEYENAKVVYENLKSNFSKEGQSVKSPISGFIKEVYVQNGQYVETGEPLFSIHKNKSLMLHADVQQKYSSILNNISTANIRTIHNNNSYSLEDLNGKIISFGKSTNAHNYLIPVNISVENNGDFVVGSFVELYLKISDNKSLTLPKTAFIEEQGYFSVFVQITPELFEKRSVHIGSFDGKRIEVLSGISAEERVVTKGAVLIKLAQATGALDPHSGHVH